MTMTSKSLLLATLGAALSLMLTGCLTQRTVTDGGQTTKQNIIVKRPVKDLIQNTQGGY
jgi:hypothetical protein